MFAIGRHPSPSQGGMTELDGDRPMKTIGMNADANGMWERRSGNRCATCRQEQHCEGLNNPMSAVGPEPGSARPRRLRPNRSKMGHSW